MRRVSIPRPTRVRSSASSDEYTRQANSSLVASLVTFWSLTVGLYPLGFDWIAALAALTALAAMMLRLLEEGA